MNSSQLLTALNNRYATKRFDPEVNIKNLEETVKEILRLTPTSFGLQAQKFIIVNNSEFREKLKEHSWNQSQVTDAQMLVVFCIPTDFSKVNIEKSVELMRQVRNATQEEVDMRMNRICGAVLENPEAIGISSHNEWLTRQLYIALGNLMTSLSVLSIDSCPLEGINPREYEKILELSDKNLEAKVALAIGTRHSEDSYQFAKKVRFSNEELFIEIQ